MSSEDLEKQETKNISKKHKHGSYLLICFALSFLTNMAEQNIQPHSLSMFSAFFLTVFRAALGGGMLYFLILWIMDLIRCRGGIERPENKIVKLILTIIFVIGFLMIAISSLILLLHV